MIARSEIDIELGVRGIADLRSGIRSGERSELRGGGEDQGLVAGLIVAGRIRSGAGLRDHLHAAIEKFDHVGNVEVVLIESGEEEDFIFLERTAEVPPPCCWRLCGLKDMNGVGRAAMRCRECNRGRCRASGWIRIW